MGKRYAGAVIEQPNTRHQNRRARLHVPRQKRNRGQSGHFTKTQQPALLRSNLQCTTHLARILLLLLLLPLTALLIQTHRGTASVKKGTCVGEVSGLNRVVNQQGYGRQVQNMQSGNVNIKQDRTQKKCHRVATVRTQEKRRRDRRKSGRTSWSWGLMHEIIYTCSKTQPQMSPLRGCNPRKTAPQHTAKNIPPPPPRGCMCSGYGSRSRLQCQTLRRNHVSFSMLG